MSDEKKLEILSDKYDVNLIIEFNWYWHDKIKNMKYPYKIQSSKSDFLEFIKQR